MMDQFTRVGEMLKSIRPDLDMDSRDGKAEIMRGLMGSLRVPDHMVAICECGWRGTLVDTNERHYDSGPDSWRHHAGRRGWHWHCPKCQKVIWKYYSEIN